MDRILTQLSSSLHAAETIDQLVRPILEMLSSITGLESTYLTSIDLDQHSQHVRFSRNCSELVIPEGLTVPWEDTLCKRALDMNQFVCDAVPLLWGDSQAATELNIQTYVSAPIYRSDGMLVGTLCGASTSKHLISSQVESLLRMFANIVGNFIERELLVERLQAANDQLAAMALTDQLTGLPNRRAIFEELGHMLALANRSRFHVLVSVIDLDGFKQINDEFGHPGGDEFLKAISQQLLASMRTTDCIGRLGGDEFLLIGPGPAEEKCDPFSDQPQTNPAYAAQHLQQRLAEATTGHFRIAGKSLIYAGASVGVVAIPPGHLDIEAAIQLADTEMYQVKLDRKAI